MILGGTVSKSSTTFTKPLLDSDHALVVADMHVRFASKNKRQNATQAVPKFRKPTEEQRLRYNLLDQQKIESEKRNCTWNASNSFESCILIDAGKSALPTLSPKQKKDYLSEQTWQTIEAKQRAINAGQWNTAKQLTRDIRKLARSDKEKSLITELELMTQEGYQWDGLKRVKKTISTKEIQIQKQTRRSNQWERIFRNSSGLFRRCPVGSTARQLPWSRQRKLTSYWW